MSMIGSSRKLKVEFYDGPNFLEYWILCGHNRRCLGRVTKRPGWKRVWDETLVALVDTVRELEEGPGLQSRTFQRSSSMMARV